MEAGRIEDTCPICASGKCTRVEQLSFYMRHGQARSDLWSCESCGSFWRSFPSPVNLEEHFALASYSDLDREEEWRQRRRSFFDHLVRLTFAAVHRTQGGLDILDVGCAYGHLMETFAEKGCRCTGIEPVAGQRELLHRRGAFAVVPSIEAVPDPGAQFDAILAIDSLYYMPGPPAAHLGRLARLLKPDGVLIMRIANRAPAIRFVRMLGRPVTDDLFGDALFCFSDRGMRILIRASGLSLESWHACEHKQIPAGDVRGYVLNRILPATTALTGLKMSPGLTYVCRSSR